MIRILAVAALALGAVACGGRQETADRPRPLEPLSIRIINHNWADMRIYLLRGGARDLLGLVTSGREVTFAAPPDMAAPRLELRLLGDPVGSRAVFESEAFLADPGQTVEWTIRARPETSRLSVY